MQSIARPSSPFLPLWREAVALFSGDWPAGFQPRWCRPVWWPLLTTCLTFFLGIGGSLLALSQGLSAWCLLLLPAWLFTVHSARKAQLVLCHHAVHNNLFGVPWLDQLLVDLWALLLLIPGYTVYRAAHIPRHHGQLTTAADPDQQFLTILGFRAGRSRQQLWRRLAWTMVSPAFHGRFLLARLRAVFVAASVPCRLQALLWTLSVGGELARTGTWGLWLLAWGIPVLLLYHMAALCQFVTEHRWWLSTDTDRRSKQHQGRLSLGRCVGEPLPRRASLVAWGRWVGRLLVYHLPVRLCVLPGDLCQHDWHHRHPKGDWRHAAYARATDQAAGCPGWPEPYTTVWGFREAVDTVFADAAPAGQEVAHV